MPHAFPRVQTDAVRWLARWALLPVMRVWAVAADEKMSDVPRPSDSPTVVVAGPDTDQVLLFGSGASVGRGVFSHALALPGSLGRELAARTGRGAKVDVVANTRTTISSAIDELARIELWRYDAIVLTIGGNDAFTLTSLHAWRRGLFNLIDYVRLHSSRSTQLILVGLQPIRNIPGFDTPLGGVAAWHARAMNQLTERVCAASAHATFVPLPPAPRSSTTRFRTANDYGPWGVVLAGRLADLLEDQA
ncbi:GDSL-type esterase/lipase family protein [Glaciibacter sp. 2TAF33]|uniref:GDSL-type esterase/lipase family protein n=1 Tax=Glaciibacter sp. 2TAF33 TaxID=3233015 RepID=UPI003F90560C